MKIGILTFWWSKNNYGQLLQCYAMQVVLRGMGHTPFLIRYRAVVNASKRFLCYRILGLLEPISFFKAVRRFFIKRKEAHRARFFEPIYRRDFERFRREKISQTPEVYMSSEELTLRPPAADVYLVGSDVVWSCATGYGDMRKVMFLDVFPEHSNKIAYAASFGRAAISERDIDNIRSSLKRFNAISVREESAVSICSSAGRSDAVHVLDPTCLLEKKDYLKLAENIAFNTKRFLFFYGLNFDNPDDVYYHEMKDFCLSRSCHFFATLSDGANLAYDRLPGADYFFDTIPEWLAHYRDSAYVVTNSFHGVVFAVLFKKQFLLIPLKGRYALLNARPISFLNSLGLAGRIYSGGRFEEKMEQPINWDCVHKKLQALRKKSLTFLVEALKNSITELA